jgi:hypothetical protein
MNGFNEFVQKRKEEVVRAVSLEVAFGLNCCGSDQIEKAAEVLPPLVLLLEEAPRREYWAIVFDDHPYSKHRGND